MERGGQQDCSTGCPPGPERPRGKEGLRGRTGREGLALALCGLGGLLWPTNAQVMLAVGLTGGAGRWGCLGSLRVGTCASFSLCPVLPQKGLCVQLDLGISDLVCPAGWQEPGVEAKAPGPPGE